MTELQQQCYSRKAIRHALRRMEYSRQKRIARAIARKTEADLFTQQDKQNILALSDSLPVSVIAQKFETDAQTIAAVIVEASQ